MIAAHFSLPPRRVRCEASKGGGGRKEGSEFDKTKKSKREYSRAEKLAKGARRRMLTNSWQTNGQFAE